MYDSDRFADTVTKIRVIVDRGIPDAVAIDPNTREVVELGTPPAQLILGFDAIITV